MAVKTLEMNVPFQQTLAATYQEFKVTDPARNCIIYCDTAFFYHPDGEDLDGDAVDATERFLFPAGIYSFKLPRSGVGHDAVFVRDGQESRDACFFAIAASTGTPTLYILAVPENVSR